MKINNYSQQYTRVHIKFSDFNYQLKVLTDKIQKYSEKNFIVFSCLFSLHFKIIQKQRSS
jgi:hypothetical protein